MPYCLRPNQRLPIVLDVDKDDPENTRATFFVKGLSFEHQVKLAADLDLVMKHDTTEDIGDAAFDLLEEYLVGWENIPGYEFGEASPKKFLMIREAMEILRKTLSGSYVQHEEKKS